MIQVCKNLIAEGDYKWIFACNCEGTEQLQGKKKLREPESNLGKK